MTSIPESTSPLQWHGDATMSVRDAVPTHPEPLSPGGDPAVPGVTISPGEDLSVLRQVLRSLQPNVMVVGPRASTVDLLSEVLASCRQPVHDVAAWPQLAWPPAGTLIFRNIGTISRSEQKVLQDRLDEEPVRVQVVSLSPTPVFPLVADGTFSAELFYRLNVVTLIAGGP
jgi:hypothetical protein